ncbi:MAG: deoxyribonuclease [Candidatus Sumerlaeota bacterium]|nr:deoxyribonuclease [Candidatus Sumerlaeota bacterium]
MTAVSPNKGLFLGSHMSVAGGVDRAPARGASVDCTAMQIFVKNNNRWQGPPITSEQAANFARELEKTSIALDNVFAHTCYLINLASPKEDVATKSVAALEDELLRCGQLDLPGLVMHPGAHLGEGRDAGIERIADRARAVLRKTPRVRTRLLLETTAGTGTNLGATFEDLRDILDAIGEPERTGVCLDTCHIFAAGYELRDPESYEATMTAFANTVGFDRLFAVHLNDSRNGLGTRKDRHDHIGKGHLGEEPFRLLLNDPRFRSLPMVLETEKGADMQEDRLNLDTLRRLASKEV